MTDHDARIPDGWRLSRHGESFSTAAGPFYYREGPEAGVAFLAEARHGNLGGSVHGGALATLADMALFTIAMKNAESFHAVTVTLNLEFLAPAREGDFVRASGEVTRRGRSLIFVRGLIETDAASVMAFSGVLKRVQR